MPPNIALLLFILFILYVLAVDFRAKDEISLVLWIPFIWLMNSAARPIAYWLDPVTVVASEVDYTIGNPINRNFLIILIALGLLILARRKIDWQQFRNHNLWILLFFIYMGLSVFWSEFPEISLKRWVKSIGNMIMVMVVLTEYNPIEATKTIFRRCAFVLIPLSVLLIKFYRHLGVAYTYDGSATMWVGVTSHKNSLGQLCFVVAFFILWETFIAFKQKTNFIDKIRIFNSLIVLVMALWILKGSPTSSSKTSIVVLTAGIITFFGLNYFKTKIQKIEIFLIIFICVFVFLQASIDIIGMIITATGRDSTLTGRIPLWKEVISMASDHPILGAGYSGFWTPDVREQMWSKFIWMPQSPHNGYIDVYINLGLVGLFLLTGVILSTYRKIKNRLLTDFNLGKFQLSLLIMILLYNIAESSFTKGQSMLWFVFLIIAMETGKVHLVKRNYGR